MAIEVNSPRQKQGRTWTAEHAPALAAILVAVLLAASPALANVSADSDQRTSSTAPLGLPDQDAQQSHAVLAMTGALEATAYATLPNSPRSSVHRSLLLEVEPLPTRPAGPPPLAPISPDPGADIIPLPASFIGGLVVLALLICIRWLRR